VAKLVSRLLDTAALWIRIQTAPKNTKWATSAKEWATHSRPQKIYKRKVLWAVFMNRPLPYASLPLVRPYCLSIAQEEYRLQKNAAVGATKKGESHSLFKRQIFRVLKILKNAVG
jgi:hypothetical protein